MAGSLIIQNAKCWTGDSRQQWIGSVTLHEGRVVHHHHAIGHDSPKVPIIDARGRFVSPGLIDSHLHLLNGGKTLTRLDLSRVSSREEFETLIAAAHARIPADEWLIGWGWSQENWGGAMPDRSWLRAAHDRPVVCHRMDIHAAVVNDAVLRRCDLRTDPPGGKIGRDASTNQPNGLMIESAAWQLVNPLIPEPDLAQRRDILLQAQKHAHSFGLTTVGSMEFIADVRDVFAPLRDQLTLRCRITQMDRAWPMGFDFARAFPNDDRLAVIGCKAFIDGTLGSRTARMLADYADDPVGSVDPAGPAALNPQGGDNRGMFVELAAEGGGHLLDWAKGVAAAGLSPSMHAIGDEAVRLALDVLDGIDPACRPRIEHAQHIDDSDFARFRGGRIASMQPLHKADDGRSVQRRLGQHRVAGTFAFRRLKDAGARLAFGSDWPVVTCDPMPGMRAAITGLTLEGKAFAADQNLTVEETLRAYTVDAAYALGVDDGGTLTPGHLGDLVIWDCDPFTADWVHAPPRITMTIVGGRVVYDAEQRCQV